MVISGHFYNSNEIGLEHLDETVVSCALVVEQRTHHQITGKQMKFLPVADWTGIVETELFAQTYKNCGLATVRYGTFIPVGGAPGLSRQAPQFGDIRSGSRKSSLAKCGRCFGHALRHIISVLQIRQSESCVSPMTK